MPASPAEAHAPGIPAQRPRAATRRLGGPQTGRRRWAGAFSPRRGLAHLVTRPAGSLPQLDGLRALSVLWVIAFHIGWFLGIYLPPEELRPLASDPLLRPLWSGDLGVDVFFVISGFLLTELLLREREATGALAVGRFYLRRALRLLPAYAVALALHRGLGLQRCETAWANLLYVNNFLPIARQCMGWSWSLAVEAQFYLLLPPLLLLALALPAPTLRRALVALAVAAFAIPLWLASAHGLRLPVRFFPTLDGPAFERFFDAFYDKPYARFGALLFGVLAAALRRRRGLLCGLAARPALAGAAALLALTLCAALGLYPAKDPALGAVPRPLGVAYVGALRPAFSLAVAYLLLLSFSAHPLGRALGRLLSHRAFYPIAQVSYSAYLLHPICIVAVLYAVHPQGLAARGPLLRFALLELALIAACSTLLYLLVERPFMSLRPASGARARSRAAPESGEAEATPEPPRAAAAGASARARRRAVLPTTPLERE